MPNDAKRGYARPSAAAPGATRPGTTGPGGRKQYTVRHGDTLWGIAQRTLGNGQRDQEIAALNQGRVGDPNEIQPGWVLDMPPDAHGPGIRTVSTAGNGGNPVGGGDHVMVDLQRADAAASALEGLRDALAQHVPAILTAISDLRGEGATLPPPTALQQLQGRSPQDAAEMRAAFRVAQAMNSQLLAQTPPIVAGGKLDIGASWTPQSLDSAAAKVDAQALAAAETSKDSRAARTAILGVTQDLADHQGDASYLTDFWSRSGTPAAAANLGGLLNRQDGRGATVLSSQDQQILATFGSSLAATIRAGQLGPAASQRLVDAFAKAPDLWSASMIFKYGPGGAAYGTGQGAELLAAVTRSVFDAREHGQYTIPLNAGQLKDGPYDSSLMPALHAYDPLEVMLQRSAENKIAATQVLGGPGGSRYAHDLLNTPFARYLDNYPDGPGGSGFQSVSPDPNGPPYGPGVREMLLNQQTVASFLDAATQGTDPGSAPPRGTDELARLSAQAALNIVQNTPNPSQIDVSEPVRHALMDTYGRYMPDIAASVENQDAGTSGQVLQAGNGTGPWIFQLPVGNSSLPAFLQQIETNHDDAAMIQAETLYSFGQAFGWQMKNGPSPAPSSDLASSLAALYAETDAQEKNLGYSQAEMTDSRNKVLDNLIQMAPLALLAPMPGAAGAAASFLLRVRFAATPWMAQAFSTSNAAQLAAIDKNDAAVKQDMVGVAMTQGLINNGVISPPPGADWYQGKPPHGKVIPTAQYSDWWNENMGYPVSQLPARPGQPPGPPLPANPYNAKLLEDWWMAYGYRMGLANSLTGAWDTGSAPGAGSAPAG